MRSALSFEDQIHSFLKALNDASARDAVGFGSNLFTRMPYYKMEVGSSGQLKKQISMQSCISLKQLP